MPKFDEVDLKVFALGGRRVGWKRSYIVVYEGRCYEVDDCDVMFALFNSSCQKLPVDKAA